MVKWSVIIALATFSACAGQQRADGMTGVSTTLPQGADSQPLTQGFPTPDSCRQFFDRLVVLIRRVDLFIYGDVDDFGKQVALCMDKTSQSRAKCEEMTKFVQNNLPRVRSREEIDATLPWPRETRMATCRNGLTLALYECTMSARTVFQWRAKCRPYLGAMATRGPGGSGP
jgi:hypothetical protein